MNYKEVKGDLIKLAINGEFDVIAHGANCFCKMGAGIAPQMAETFGCNRYHKERHDFKGDINKLGTIDYAHSYVQVGKEPIVYTSPVDKTYPMKDGYKRLAVVNAYTQYNYGRNHTDGDEAPVDYEAITLCMRKINNKFKGQHIGLPKIGAGLAGGDWERIKSIIQNELTECDVTVVIFDK